jgi:S1-C subfamily serine protease
VRPTREVPQAESAGRDGAPGPSGGRGSRVWIAIAAVAAIGIAAVAIVLVTRGSTPQLSRAQVTSVASSVVSSALQQQQRAPATSALVYQKILPSIVTIQTKKPSAKKDVEEFGAGVIVNTNGSIMTALHVVSGATSIEVGYDDGTSSSATIASADPAHDIAVLTPAHTPNPIVPAVLGGVGQVGDPAYAVGHPLGFIASLTAGVISGLDRTVKAPNGKTLHGLIQFDAAVNPGSSGGPLLNRGGQVVGIVTSLASGSPNGYFIGIGFAVPIAAAGGADHIPLK